MHPPSTVARAATRPTAQRRTFLKQSAGLGALAVAGGCNALPARAASETAAAGTLSYSQQNPVPALPVGGTIAVLAPASPAADKLEQAAAWLSARGFTPHLMASASAGGDYLAGSDTLRANDLHQAFADPGIDAIFCLRGGYGSMHLLDRIDYALLARHPKPFVGYSDITALLLAFARRAGLVTFHGPMLASDLIIDKRAPTEAALFDMLQGRCRTGDWLPHPAEFALETLAPGSASGRLVGGNLATIGATLGTPYEIDLENAILFIEDVGETPQKIDRLLTQLRLSGKLAQISGVLIGDFSELNDPRTPLQHPALERQRLHTVWRELLLPLRVPVLAGWRSGHCDPNLCLPIGAMVRLEAGTQRLRLEQEVVYQR